MSGALTKFFAKAVVEGFPGSTNVKRAAVNEIQLANRISEIMIETQIAGSSFLKAHIIDPELALTVSGWLEVKEGLLKPIEVEFPEGSKWFWILCAVEGSTDVQSANLILTFEDRIVYFLRQYYGTKFASPGIQTRAQFVRGLITEIGSRGESKAGFICPSLNVVQVLETEAQAESKKTHTAQDKQEKEEAQQKRGGLGAGSITIEGQPVSRQKALDISTAIQTANKLKAGTLEVEALIAAGIAESGFDRSVHENHDPNNPHQGIWQSQTIPGNEVARQAEHFLIGGESFKEGGAKGRVTAGIKNPAQIGVEVEIGGSQASMERVLPEARKIIAESGGITGGSAGSTEESVSDVGQLQRGTSANPDEDSFECAVRLATQVSWFFFSDNRNFFYMDGLDLMKQKPALYLDIPKNHIRFPNGQTRNGAIHAPTTFHFDNCLALDTPIPTPEGWTTMGDIKVGDRVFGGDGRPIRVKHCSRIFHDDDCYEVRFRDGSTIIANGTHEWETYTDRTCIAKGINGDKNRGIYTTEEIAKSIHGYDKPPKPPRYNHRVKLADPLELPRRDLPVDPYILGYWLGDGHHKSPQVYVGNQDLGNILIQMERAGYDYRLGDNASKSSFGATETCWRVSMKARDGDSLPKRLQSLGVWGNKHIPTEYLRASIDQRLALLQGLMDSDGSISKHCCLQLGKRDLAEQAQEIVHSLGFRSTLSDEDPVGIQKLRRYRLVFSSRKHVNVFRLPRKAKRYAKRIDEKVDNGRAAFRPVIAVTAVPSVPVRCIEVEAEDHIFLAGRAMCRNRNTTFEYRVSHKLKTRVQRKSKAIKPASPAEVKLHLECDINQFHAGEAFRIVNSGPMNGQWIITNTRRECLKDIFTEIILEPPVEPLPEPRSTGGEGEVSTSIAGGASPGTGEWGWLIQSTATYAGMDQGIDFTGPGTIFALDNGKITRLEASGSGWPGEGALLVYELTAGQNKGKFIYMAEDLKPAPGLAVNGLITKGQPIAQATGSSKAPGIEVGFAQNAQGQAFGSITDGKGSNPPNPEAVALKHYITGK